MNNRSLRALLVHPQDSLRQGPWADQTWDLVVDLGRSSEATERFWSELAGCPVLRLESFRKPIADTQAAGKILRTGNGVLFDSDGLDWWELTGLFVHDELETAMLLRRLVESAPLPSALFATRLEWPINAIAHLAKASITNLGVNTAPRKSLRHYADQLRKLHPAQIAQIAFDKYDGGYLWRGALTPVPPRSHEPVVLLPSAYTNVSRMASRFANLLPDQKFVLIATRRSGLEFDPPHNVRISMLAAYAPASSGGADSASLLQRWPSLLIKLKTVPELDTLFQIGHLDRFPRWLRDGVRVRDAWKRVFDREPVQAVLCGDDSNWYTRLPVELARRRGIPTIDFHHGAFDGRFLLKSLPSDLYLAKSEAERDYMVSVCGLPAERVVLAAWPAAREEHSPSAVRRNVSQIVFFSEPYEVLGGRPEEIYRELLPALCRLATRHGASVVVKLHPFESLPDRTQLVNRVLSAEPGARAQVVSGPLRADLLCRTWFGLTVESSTVVDCTNAAVPCFLCGWLGAGHFGYVEQFARFGIGHLLRSPGEIPEIPQRLRDKRACAPDTHTPRLTAEMLRGLLSLESHVHSSRSH